MKKGRKVNTKQRILDTAIELFNKNGVQSVTSRHIATEMGISNGNLDYHFNNKEVLLLAIYKQMREEMSYSYKEVDPGISSFEQIHRLLGHLEGFQYKYRFFNLDVLEISRTYPKINRLLRNTFRIRKQQMSDIFKRAIQEGFLVKATENHIEQLLLSIRIVITFWLSQEELQLNAKPKKGSGGMSENIWLLLLPYMTQDGKDLYRTLIGKAAE
ncbi:MAG: TetR/AcrR family transcriptional regulator [Lunatimonas sp.]|uniref:TetR/AcrR family transcriptional regulator n=1 Tax=Lunatimonas sp. TaxID=2060141 RepID=UPI00263A842C|nr:TetR/AcrR family transcriptional regulator [Lunatimonas sp.]MCC5937620.1 TetR/AcrR family transcriptional regulator [Lunatimonas sp.]